MRNQKPTLIILLAILTVLILLILFVIPRLGRTEVTEMADERIFLCPLERTDLASLQYTAHGNTHVLTLVDGTWVDGSGIAADQDAVAQMLSAVAGLYSTQLAFEGEAHFADCGLDRPTLTVTASGPKGGVLITVGSYNNALDRWYCTVNGSTDIYLIGSNLPTRFGAN